MAGQVHSIEASGKGYVGARVDQQFAGGTALTTSLQSCRGQFLQFVSGKIFFPQLDHVNAGLGGGADVRYGASRLLFMSAGEIFAAGDGVKKQIPGCLIRHYLSAGGVAEITTATLLAVANAAFAGAIAAAEKSRRNPKHPPHSLIRRQPWVSVILAAETSSDRYSRVPPKGVVRDPGEWHKSCLPSRIPLRPPASPVEAESARRRWPGLGRLPCDQYGETPLSPQASVLT